MQPFHRRVYHSHISITPLPSIQNISSTSYCPEPTPTTTYIRSHATQLLVPNLVQLVLIPAICTTRISHSHLSSPTVIASSSSTISPYGAFTTENRYSVPFEPNECGRCWQITILSILARMLRSTSRTSHNCCRFRFSILFIALCYTEFCAKFLTIFTIIQLLQQQQCSQFDINNTNTIFLATKSIRKFGTLLSQSVMVAWQRRWRRRRRTSYAFAYRPSLFYET